MGVETTGVLSKEELARLPGMPSAERLAKGKVVVIECGQEFPCNPCETVCPKEAIKVGEPLTNLPVLYEDLCDGCGICIPACPGLAVFVVDMQYSEKEALVYLPYELLPLPQKGQVVKLLNREGQAVGEGTVVAVANPPRFRQTAVVRVAVPQELATEVRHIAF